MLQSYLHRGWKQYLVVIMFAILFTRVLTKDDCQCTFAKHKGVQESDIEKLRPLCGKRYPVQDPLNKYTYNVGICTTAIHDTDNLLDDDASTAGAVQTAVGAKIKKDQWVLGRINQSEIMSGANWIYLEYEGGTPYGASCSREQRRTVIMITCLPGVTNTSEMRMLEENPNKTQDCHYLFEIGHDAACSKSQEQDTGLSAGSVICIILACTVGAYLIFGGLYMRCVLGAKGWRQIPNYDFWRDFGNLQADGCDLICRCGGKERESSNHYHGIGDHQIESANDDEHILPM